jgi:hypothetical protein
VPAEEPHAVIIQYTDAFLDIAIIEYDMIKFLPSIIAISAIKCVIGILGLEYLSIYFESQVCFNSPEIDTCTNMLVDFFSQHFPDFSKELRSRPISPNTVFSHGSVSNSSNEQSSKPVENLNDA